MDDQIVLLMIGLMIVVILCFISRKKQPKEMVEEEPVHKQPPVKKKPLFRKNDTVLNHVKVIDAEGSAEIDMLIINPRGLFVLVHRKESGKLTGKSSQEKWRHIYADERGKRKSEEIDNPVHKLEHDMFVLIRYLKHHGYSIGVHGYVYCSNEDIICHNRAVLKGESALAHKIHHVRSQHLSYSYRKELITLFSAS